MMKHFAIVALAAVPTFAQWQWSTYGISQDGKSTSTYLRTTPTSVFNVSGDEVKIEDNKSVFMKKSNSADTSAMYTPSLVGGSVSYGMNVSDIDCGCVSGLYLVQTGGDCNEDARTGTPTCPVIEVMQANKSGFNVSASAGCSLKMKENGVAKYGSGAYGVGGSIIDTRSDFDVKTEFISDEAYTSVFKLRTTLTQNQRTIMMEAECDELKSMTNTLDNKMGFVMSHWEDDTKITDIEQTCGSSRGCKANTFSSFSGFTVKQDGSTEAKGDDGDNNDGDDGDNDGDDGNDGNDGDDGDDGDKGELVYGGPASSVNACDNAECTKCVEAWYENDTATVFNMCLDEQRFKYSNKCNKRKDLSACGADDLCHMSYPEGDRRKNRSVNAACRPVPDKLVNGDFVFARRKARSSRWGLCVYGCGAGECRSSYLNGDS